MAARARCAAAFVVACRARDWAPPTGLRLLQADPLGGDGAVDPADVDLGADVSMLRGPEDLGALHHDLVRGRARVRRGAWYTPMPLARELVDSLVDAVGSVCDPACGGGAFLLAAADRLVALGATPQDVVGECLYGVDLDPDAVAVTEAALWWWGRDHGVDLVPAGCTVADALAPGTIPTTRYVVGNPPFLGRLKSATAAAPALVAQRRAAFGDAVQPYTDDAWLFLLAAVRSTTDDGAVCLVQPRSVLAARDAAAVRARIDDLAELERCWLDDRDRFDAQVRTCAPMLRRRPGPSTNDWTRAVRDADAVPVVAAAGAATTLGQAADVGAGFRDEYYGLVGAVRERRVGDGPSLVTSGRIDPFRIVADRPVRFAKRRWEDPVVDPADATDAGRRWIDRQRAPKLVVATQTKVLEVAADPAGDCVAGVPASIVVPADPEDLWHLLAALAAPCTSARLAATAAGSGLSAGAIRVSAPALAALALPVPGPDWDEAAERAQRLHDAAGVASHQDWEGFGRAADAAYGVDDARCRNWWLARLSLP